MARATVAIIFFMLSVATINIAATHFPAESPKLTMAPLPLRHPSFTKKSALAKAPGIAAASTSRKSGPAAAPITKSSEATLRPKVSTPVSAEVSGPPAPPTAATSPAVEGLAKGPTNADRSGDTTLGNGATISATMALAIGTVIFS